MLAGGGQGISGLRSCASRVVRSVEGLNERKTVEYLGMMYISLPVDPAPASISTIYDDYAVTKNSSPRETRYGRIYARRKVRFDHYSVGLASEQALLVPTQDGLVVS